MGVHDLNNAASAHSESNPQSKSQSKEGKAYAGKLWQYKQAETVSLMIHVGRRLGLFSQMSKSGAVTAAKLAEMSGLHERWVLEWLRLQTAAGIIDLLDDQVNEEEHFLLPETGTKMLGDESSTSYMLDSFDGGTSAEALEDLLESFHTGIGHTYESTGAEGAKRGEARHWRAARNQVLPTMIPALEGVEDKLTEGCLVADVGCGDGAVVLALAEAFPKSSFHAFDASKHSVARIREVASEMKLNNVEVTHARGEDLPQDSAYDLIITFDCIHDMTKPQEVIAKIRGSIKADGTWFIKDIRSKPKLRDNLRNPMLAMMYGFSLMSCMSSAMSEPGGAGLGTLGFNPEVAENMSRAAGFSRFKMHDFKDPGNLYYEVRV
ncbi:MAG: class I SAM-dependent methyltransferase [Pseudomonadales bacterium]